ncbi:MAG TPA: hypothetical protein VHA78_03940 [Candidatus Peribacteraceae bacterium]|nr:hypothetical protein [Candidatus Peribacteraceae bacterium]
MSPRVKLVVTAVLLVFLGGLGIADYYLSGSSTTADITNSQASTAASVATTPAANTGAIQQPGTGVSANNGPDIQATIQSQGFSTEPSTELSFLAQVAGSGAQIHSLAILQNNDRVGSVTWIESPTVKTDFIALKQALLTAFTPKVQGLQDQTIESPNAPVRNVLSFFDPGLSEEKLTFVRVRQRLFEFHIANGKDDVMNGLIQALTTK